MGPSGGRRYVYTAITGRTDALAAPGAIPPGWRCVCFSDSEDHPEWETRQPSGESLDPVRRARLHKLMPHTLFPDAEISLWIDGNVSVECDLDSLVEAHLGDCDIAFHAHPQRDCIYDEAVACLRRGKDDPEAVLQQAVGYALDGHPRHAGLVATAVVLRRHTPEIAAFNERWWKELESGSHRDQISAPVVLSEMGVRFSLFDSALWEGPLFGWRRHDGSGRRKGQRPPARHAT